MLGKKKKDIQREWDRVKRRTGSEYYLNTLYTYMKLFKNEKQ